MWLHGPPLPTLGISQGMEVVPQAGAIAWLPALSASLKTPTGFGGGQPVILSGGADPSYASWRD